MKNMHCNTKTEHNLRTTCVLASAMLTAPINTDTALELHCSLSSMLSLLLLPFLLQWTKLSCIDLVITWVEDQLLAQSLSNSKISRTNKVGEISYSFQLLSWTPLCSWSAVLPVTSGCFSRSRSEYLSVVLVVSVPAENKSATVITKLS